MSVLLLRLAGPMQAWGTQSRFSIRDTGLEPSKSGVLGLLCAAMGKPRTERPGDGFPSLKQLGHELTMAVRVDKPGTLACDYHTALNVAKADGKRAKKPRDPKFTVTSRRFYLADADFLVGLEGPGELLQRLDEALRDPVWALYLGRKAFPPALPVRTNDGLHADASLPEALKTHPWWRRTAREEPDEDGLRIVMELSPGQDAEVRNDVPLSFLSARRAFSARGVRDVEMWKIHEDAPDLIQEWPPCSSRN